MRRSLRYERYARDVADFITAYESLHECVKGNRRPDVFSSGLAGLTDPKGLELFERTGMAAGRAQPAVEAAELYEWFQGRTFSPLLDWQNSSRPGHPNTPSRVLSYSRSVQGRLEQLADEARDAEAGMAGLVGRLVRFPADVREAAGLSSPAGRGVSFAAGVAAQVVAGLLLAGILAVIGLLIAHL